MDQLFQPVLDAAERNNQNRTATARDIDNTIVLDSEHSHIGTAESGGDRKALTKSREVKNKLEARKKLRAERTAILKDLMDSKPDEKYEDPKDVSAIRYAELHMGDYKLKTADNYIVPESERVDADKKKRQILLLTESVNNLKEQFNNQVFALRDKKKSLVDSFTKHTQRIVEINAELVKLGNVVDTNVPIYSMDVINAHANLILFEH